MLRTLDCIFFPSNIALAFLMSREKYYTHAVGQRQKYYEAEGILLVLVDKRSIAQPSILLWRKMYDITLYFRPLRSFSFASLFLSLFFLRFASRKREKRDPTRARKIASRADLWKHKENKIKIIYHNSPQPPPCAPVRELQKTSRSQQWNGARYYTRGEETLSFAIFPRSRVVLGSEWVAALLTTVGWNERKQIIFEIFPFISESLGFCLAYFVALMYTCRVRAQSGEGR